MVLDMRSLGYMTGILAALVTVCMSQAPVIPALPPYDPSGAYYYSGYGAYGADARAAVALSGYGPFGTDARIAAALSGYGYGTDAAALAAAAVAGYPYTDSYYYSPAIRNMWGYPSYFGNQFFDWASYLPTDPIGWRSFVGALPLDIQSAWNSYYRIYGTGVPNAASLWGRFLGQLPSNQLSIWQNWWGKNYNRRWNSVGYPYIGYKGYDSSEEARTVVGPTLFGKKKK